MPGEIDKLRTQRFRELMANLAAQEISQLEVARRSGLPPQYVSDVKHGRRPVTELFARRLAAQFEFDHEWLLGSGTSSASLDSCGGDEADAIGGLTVPVFGDPMYGPPRNHHSWNGDCIELAGIAAAKARGALDPYVLRFRADDREEKLLRNDLVLISQRVDETAELQVVAVSATKVYLARKKSDSFERVSRHARNSVFKTADVDVVGHCLGIVWRQL